MIGRLTQTLGALRLFLAGLTLLLVMLAPFASGEASYLDWGMVPTVLAPIFTVMMFFVLPLDMIMTRVFIAGTLEDEERGRLWRVFWIEGALMALLIGAWTPFIMALLPD